MSEKEISEIIKNKQAIYDLKIDKKLNKYGPTPRTRKFKTI